MKLDFILYGIAICAAALSFLSQRGIELTPVGYCAIVAIAIILIIVRNSLSFIRERNKVARLIKSLSDNA